MKKNTKEELIEFFISYSFDESQVRSLVFSYNRYKDNFTNLEDLKSIFESYRNSMLISGYSEESLRELVTFHPKAMFQKFKNGALEEYYKKYLRRKKTETEELTIEEKVEANRRTLLSLGIDSEKVSCILKTNLPLTEMSPKYLKSNISFYLSCEITEEELENIVRNNSTVLLFGEYEYDILFKEFSFFTKENLGRMIVYYSKNNTIVQPDCLYKTLKFASTHDLDKEKLKKCLQRNIIKNLDEEDLDTMFNNLIEIGFNYDQARICTSEYIPILYKTKEKIEYIIEVARRYAVAKEDIISIITGFPAFTDLSEDKIREKIAVMTRYNLTSYVIVYPKSLIEGAELIDARASYLRIFHPKVSGSEFASDVFVQEKAFEKKYNRGNSYLKELMPLLKK